MKPSYVITAVVLVLLVLVAVLLYGHADGPTSATNAEALARRTLPADLPTVVEPNTSSTDADLSKVYEDAIDLIREHPNVQTKTPEHDALVDRLCELLLQAAVAGDVPIRFMDAHIPVRLGAEPDFGDAIELINEWVLQRSAYLYTRGEPEQASDLALAAWMFGRRMFERNVRLYNRNTGLDMMESAGGMLFEMSANNPRLDAEALRAWSAALKDIREAWQPKLELMLGVNPHPGDLVNIAMHDEDLTFRIEATLRCGLHRHGADRGNRRAMQRAIDEAIASNDPMLVEAGRAADAFTLEDRRRFY